MKKLIKYELRRKDFGSSPDFKIRVPGIRSQGRPHAGIGLDFLIEIRRCRPIGSVVRLSLTCISDSLFVLLGRKYPASTVG